uniref:SCAN box domain-containing protein n=1 Tax=Pelusios castaneus TaxID=367368 RepID=A0A8C8SNM8_9SAUR
SRGPTTGGTQAERAAADSPIDWFACPSCHRGGERPAWSQLKEACRRWLQLEGHSKEELLDTIVLEQFLHVLPSQGRRWVMSSPRRRVCAGPSGPPVYPWGLEDLPLAPGSPLCGAGYSNHSRRTDAATTLPGHPRSGLA